MRLLCFSIAVQFQSNIRRFFCVLPIYSEAGKDACTRKEDARLLVIEGTLVLNEPRIHDLCSLRYYFTLPYEISKQRRNDKVYDCPDPPMNFDRVVWPQYLKHKAQLNDDPTIIFVNCHDNDLSTVLHLILSGISELRHSCELRENVGKDSLHSN